MDKSTSKNGFNHKRLTQKDRHGMYTELQIRKGLTGTI